jgi:hypothetical protein
LRALTLEGAEIVRMGENRGSTGMFWRYLIGRFADAEAAIFRDTDSILSNREASVVKEWLRTGRAMHVMRDHPWHSMPIMGGMWGLRGKHNLKILQDNVQDVLRSDNPYGADQEFLKRVIYPRFCQSLALSASFNGYELTQRAKLPPRIGLGFIGERTWGDSGLDLDLENRQTLSLHQESKLRCFLLFWTNLSTRLWVMFVKLNTKLRQYVSL